jgi:trk system potassium uptake protein TrkA
MHVAILGCGRVGARVANSLARQHDVTVIDWSSRAFDRLSADFGGQTVLGNGIDVDVLRSAGMESAALFFALTDLDNRNLMAAQVAKELGARCVIARVYDPVRADTFAAMGIMTVCPTVKGAEALFDLVTAP